MWDRLEFIRRAILFAMLGAGVMLSPLCSAADDAKADTLEAIRADGDIKAERRHVWAVIEQMMAANPGALPAALETWHGERDTFSGESPAQEPGGIRGFSRSDEPVQSVHAGMAGIPVMTYTLYNDAAYEHIRRYGLDSAKELDRLRSAGAPDEDVPGNRKIPDFPESAIVVKTAWWPVAASGLTPLPVWDPVDNPALPGGNPYTGWKRAVAIDPALKTLVSSRTAIDFAGRHFPKAVRVGMSAFYHVDVDRNLAARVMQDPEAGRAMLLALGRPLREGDHLMLVSANFALREIRHWIWSAMWWHDAPYKGPFASEKPSAPRAAWAHYLMQTAWDAELPREADGSPHVCFNPWLEGRFPRGGVQSNCMACHQRASYPAQDFLPVTRGAPNVADDPAYAAGSLRTSLIWAIALHPHQ
jgi:hypothetical protein